MLTEKDYCDYETCVALKELGYNKPTLAYYAVFLPSRILLYSVIDKDEMPEDEVNIFNLLTNHNKYKDSKFIDAPTLYEAQKWLREEKNIDISVTISPFEYFATIREFVFWQGEYSWEKTIHPNGGKTYEEALSEGIKEAIKILKEK